MARNTTEEPKVEEVKVEEVQNTEEPKVEETEKVEEVKVEETKTNKKYVALVSFCGLVTMAQGEEKEIADEKVAKDLLKAKYIKEVK